MSIDTNGFLNKEITGKDIFNVVTQKFDKNAKYHISIDSYDNSEMGNIVFKYKEENRKLFYCITADKEEGTKFINDEKHVCLKLGKWGTSINIMVEVIKCFGGYIDEDDCDEIPAYYIPKDEDFKYDKYVEERNKIINVLSSELTDKDKTQIAQEILKHRKEIKKIL